MKPLLKINPVKNMSLRDIENKIEELIRSGYCGAAVPREASAAQLAGFCRSAYRHGAVIWLYDDSDIPSGSGGGEVTSVPEFRPGRLELINKNELGENEAPLLEKEGTAIVIRDGGGLWGADPFNPEAVQAFIDCAYIPISREFSRFTGHELAGMITRFHTDDSCLPYSPRLSLYIKERLGFSPEENPEHLFPEAGGSPELRHRYLEAAYELFTRTCLKAISEFCVENGLELLGDSPLPLDAAGRYVKTDTAFPSLEGLCFSERRAALIPLLAQGKTRFAVSCGLGPDFAEALWCGGIHRLTSLTDGVTGKAAELDLPPMTDAFVFRLDSGDLYVISNRSGSEAEIRLDLNDLREKYLIDSTAGKAYILGDSGALEFALEKGGCAAILCGGSIPSEPLPPFTADGAVFQKFSKPVPLPIELVEIEDNTLPLKGENGRYCFEAQYTDGAMKVSAPGADFVTVNASSASGPDFDISGLVRMGGNCIETNGQSPCIIGEIFTDEASLLPPAQLGAGNIRAQSMPYYCGSLKYSVLLPPDCGGKYLRLDGSFDCAFIKIGRHKEALICSPFAVELFAADEGRSAEITVYPVKGQTDAPFGLDSANIVVPSGCR